MPLKRTNWVELMRDAVRADNNETRSFYSFGNMLFLDEMPRASEDLSSNLHMLRHVYRYAFLVNPIHLSYMLGITINYFQTDIQ